MDMFINRSSLIVNLLVCVHSAEKSMSKMPLNALVIWKVW